MPYITQQRREIINNLENFDSENISTGDLNYIISSVIKMYLLKHQLKYDKINEVIGVLECAKLELYRRIASPYEDIKASQNGDVWGKVVNIDNK